MSNSACNPVIYYQFNRRYRCCVRYLLRWLPGMPKKEITERYKEAFWIVADNLANGARRDRASQLRSVGITPPRHASVECVSHECANISSAIVKKRRRRVSSSSDSFEDEYLDRPFLLTSKMRTHLSMPLGFGALDTAKCSVPNVRRSSRLRVSVREGFDGPQIEAEPVSAFE